MTVAPHRPGPAGWLSRAGGGDRPSRPVWPAGLPRLQRVEQPPPPQWRTTLTTSALGLLSLVLLVLLMNLTVVSQLQHWNSQRDLYSKLRLGFAEGSSPIGQLDINGKIVESGTPIALLRIPRLGLREVVVEGTSSRTTKLGVGHRRDTPFPGQPGVAILMGRAAAYGGPLGGIGELQRGDKISVSTGQGIAQYEVIGPRNGATQLPVLGPSDGRLTLITADGPPFAPTSVLRVDAKLISKAQPRPPIAIAPGVVADEDQAMSGDSERAFSLSWLSELLLGLSLAAVWAWKRWNRRAAYVVFLPALTVTAFACADRVIDLLPNLL
ncbi:sortase [Nocardioides sp.]|uniref:sortase n=1 Tax=Nocardioides sp. TaxID=35761 RepID=UPI003513CC0F